MDNNRNITAYLTVGTLSSKDITSMHIHTTSSISKAEKTRGSFCPESHPYAYWTDNQYCCKYNKEKVYAPQVKVNT